ncbi:hypothetical protein C474_12476 [Halogeometricum pallidum JCM 14848]|uniref:Uncharacterized protein n=1 Tax=Halogeometricum pallidum JCM 14848 TaxID=1227487 RepID=M0D320_HALPD|nr:DUF5995 family protein [Halogeometricum pallidum]ELZ29850.1 hypothetical protein C474_12476 [Halogeometricum pallidum JCM 14848]
MGPTVRSSGPARRRRRFRAAAEGVRRRPPTAPARRGDSELLALSAEPYVDAAEAHDRLRALCAAFEARRDRRAAFLSVYVRMTGAVAARVRREEFEDPEWVHDYLVAFANLYREAIHDYESGNLSSLADPWLLAFDAAERGDSLVLQDTALGVNAHINYDLSLAVAAVGVDPDRAAKRADHRAVTDVIRDVVDETQDALAARDAAGLRMLDESLGSFDERFLVFTVDECRDSAWRTAVALRSRFGARRRLARWTNAVTSTGAAHLILSSRASDRVHESLRTLERTAGEDR